jgi:peptidyl-dipeptidase A
MDTRAPARLLAVALALVPAAARPTPSGPGQARPTAAQARAFVARVNADLLRLWSRQQTAEWVKSTYITVDTERIAAEANEETMAYFGKATREAERFRGVRLDADTRRMLELLRVSVPLPAPADPARRADLAATAAWLEGTYGKGKWCGKDGKAPCRDLQQLSDTLAKSRDWDVLLDAWAGWHTISVPMRPRYQQLVDIANQGAREIGFRDVGELWRAGYDMTPAAFEAEVERLWVQVKPLYEQLHCYARARLQQVYGKERLPDGKPIPAHLLGNMWAQAWGNVYPLLEPYPGAGSLDVDAALVRQGWGPERMARTGEAFFTSLGFAPLPATFWERSMLQKPRDREVVCHASAWSLDFQDDLRIKMCIEPTEDDLATIHHELGHNYYQWAYKGLPALFQQGANEGFHEAIGDTIALSVTPAYYQRLGLLPAVAQDEKAVLNFQMKVALERIAFLPFGKLMDQWRWGVFSGRTPPSRWNASWWELKEKVQGVSAPLPRSEADFDPGAKYHIPANVSYARYFLAHVYEYQFHRAMCRLSGHQGPLHTCSVHGSKEAGARLQAMLALGASKPWPEAMAVLTGQRQADASAILDYFAPLRAWLEEQNKGRTCGW